MKITVLLLFAFCVIASCSKSKTEYITKTVTDTVFTTKQDTSFVVLRPSITGSWLNGSNRLLITFDSLTFYRPTPYGYGYALSSDTLFRLYPGAAPLPLFTYTLSVNSDTLTLYELEADSSPTLFTRL